MLISADLLSCMQPGGMGACFCRRHSYYRHNVEENLSYLSSYIEDEVFYVMNYLYSVHEMRVEMEGKYFHADS
ncbi:hypothetical protein BTM36_00010 [Herbaspirillum sp. VT-16-41]|nr:hypothetical protein BTM36_00010 [Herbaspirillum sp. VT-16-41]